MSGNSLPVIEKYCPLCEQVSPAKDFWVSRNTKDGLYSWCKPCTKARRKARYDPEYHRQYRLDNLELKREYDRQRYAENPDKRKLVVRRAIAKDPDRYAEQRRQYYECNRDYFAGKRRAYQHPDPGRARQLERMYRHKRRAIEAGARGSHTDSEVWQLAESQHWLCAYCEVPLFGRFHTDHMVPLSRGGSNDWTNLAITCPACNVSKGTKTAEEFWIVLKGRAA